VLAQWEKVVNVEERWGSIAAQALYGKDFDVSASGTGGNNVMAIYQKSKELDNRYSFALFAADQSWLVAKASGLGFVDKDSRRNEKYLYRVFIAGIQGDTGYVYTGAADKKPLPAPRDLRAEKTTKAVMLSWDKVLFSNLYNAYILERSDDDGKSYHPVTKEPIVNADRAENKQPQQRMFYIDTVPQVGQPKVYRVRGVTAFGQIGASSDTIHTVVMEEMNAHPSITGTAILNNGVLIKWMMPPSPVKLKGFDIERSSALNKKYTKINNQLLSAKDSVFMDQQPKRSNYYKVRAYTMDGRSTISYAQFVQLEDSIPPAAPDSLAGLISDSGIVSLKWKANTEDDIYGYRVFRANGPDEEFVQVTREPARKNALTDTITVKTLTKYVYYKIVALDGHYNPSDFSAVLKLKRPDVVPPVPPVFTDAHTDQQGVFLQWQPSTSEDVVVHKVMRAVDTAWQEIAAFKNADSIRQYTDTSGRKGVKYSYVIAAVDDSGLRGLSKVLAAQRLDMGTLDGDKVLKAAIDRDNKHIRLKWMRPEGTTRIWVYRSAEGGPMRLFKTLEGNVQEFIDTDLLVNTVYRYKVKLQRQSDGASLFTEEITVNY
jgi:fibronectin type 3 domain-containing protein